MTTVGVGLDDGTSDAAFPRSVLRRERRGLVIGNVGGVCRDTRGRDGAEMSVD